MKKVRSHIPELKIIYSRPHHDHDIWDYFWKISFMQAGLYSLRIEMHVQVGEVRKVENKIFLAKLR